MAETTEIERLLVRLVGDNKLYVETLKEAERRTQEFTQDANGRFRDAKGRYVAMATAMSAQAGAQLKKLYDLGQGFKRVGEAAMSAGRAMKSFGMSMSLKITAPIMGTGLAAAKTFGDFEQVMTQMQGLAGVASGEIDGITQAIHSLASETGKGPTELAESMYNIRSSGVQGKTAMDVLTVSAKAAAAGLGETRVVSDAVTSALNAYGTENLSAARAVDILVATVREGKAEADEIAPVMGRLIPVASAMGIQFEEVAGIMAVMSRTGSDAAEASVSVGAIMNTLLKPSKEAEKALRSAGLSMQQLRDIAKKPGGMIEVMRILDRTFKDNEEALSTIIPETRAFRGVMNVLAQDASLVDQVMGNVANSAGAAEAAFQAGAGSLNRTFSQAMSELKTSLISFGETMKPALIGLIDKVRGVIEWFTQLSTTSKKYVIIAGLVAASIGPIAMAFGSLIVVAGHLMTLFGSATASAMGLRVAMIALKAGGIGLAIVAIGALIVGAYKLSRAFSHAIFGTVNLNKELEKTKNIAAKFNVIEGERFSNAMEGLADLPVDKQRAELEVMKKNLEGNIASTKNIVSKTQEEINTLENDGGWLSAILPSDVDAAGIEMAKEHLADAQGRGAQFASQLDEVKAKLKELEPAVAAAGEGLAGTLRPEAIEAFSKEMEAQLRNLEIEHRGTELGKTSEQIQRAQALVALEHELSEAGATMTKEEREKLVAMQQQMSLREAELKNLKEGRDKVKKELEEKKKAQEDLAKKAEEVLKASMTPIQELKQQILEIQEMERAGALSEAESKAAQDRLVGDYAAANEVDKASAGAAIEFGGAESQANVMQESQKSTEQGIWRMVDEATVNNRTQKEILAEMRRQQLLMVDIPG